jgi:DEAD/DEAH box helicase/Helicase conserved C-terminal domain
LTTGTELAQDLLASETLVEAMDQLALESVWRDLPAIVANDGEIRNPDLSHALTCASLFAQVANEKSQEAALRIAQGCVLSPMANQAERDAAILLLERMGNRLALQLASARSNTSNVEDAWDSAPGPLRLDVIRRRMELAIPLSSQKLLSGNPFQRELWTSMENASWVSASAPTSAGKSFVVKRWFEEKIARSERFRGVYIVPTRALIEEVSREFRAELPEEVGTYSIPWDKDVNSRPHEVYVLTQERLHFLHELLPGFTADLLFIDEAQKLGDKQRGVLLQRVLADSVSRNDSLQVVFASPMAANPELLLEGGPDDSRSVAAETVTVNQNLLWVNQVPYKPERWTATLIDGERDIPAGEFTLPARPVSKAKRLPYVAVALGKDTTGNVVYVSGAAAAEKAAGLIAEALGPAADLSENQDIQDLCELIKQTIHRNYALLSVLNRGVAFHYGNMPLLVRQEIERLFRIEVLQYLVCTSTLLEGVNLPCRNIFARGPKKGKTPMTPADFWNLAGRAGRWGKEFEGNIICVDTRGDTWETPPRLRQRTNLTRASEPVFNDLKPLREYIEAGAPVDEVRARSLEEDIYSFLASRILNGHRLAELENMPSNDPGEVEALEAAITNALEKVELPEEVLRRHAGISPPAMQRLLTYIRGHDDQDAMLLAKPESDDAAVNYKRALTRCNKQLGSDFGGEKRCFQLAILVVEWMKGARLAYLISKRIEINTKRGDRAVARDIRAVMKDIDEIARFAAPRYLACYLDVLKFHLEQVGREDEIEDLPDVAMMLELGVARTTEVSMMALGLSRASAVELEEHISKDELTPEECLDWLQKANIEGYGLPRLVEREIQEVLDRATPMAA